MALSTRLLALRRSPVLLKLPPYLSLLCIVIGFAWLLILPLNEYSRQTYVSENAILPGQVHTYFGGSEHNVFRAYRQEVFHLSEQPRVRRLDGLEEIMSEYGLKTARQTYNWKVAGEEISGTNVYGLLAGPRADATEAMVLIAAWRNFAGQINYSGVALALTLARYFKRWSIWSKDILVLIPEDSVYGPEAWVAAYHSTIPSGNISSLPIKAGALQGAVALDYPAGPWGHRFDKLDVLYDGINGALPNLDLLNTAVSVASGQMGIGCTLHDMNDHDDGYKDRLLTLGKGLITQSVGHATGPHSAFMPYHIDAITLRTIGDGWHDEMSLGRTAESLFRSINNLLEHLHQSFFFYILLNTNRFVSIGNYLPAAMIMAGSFTITALALWVQSGKATKQETKPSSVQTRTLSKKSTKLPELEPVRSPEGVTLVPKADLEVVERKMFRPALTVLAVHFAGFIPLYLLTHTSRSLLPSTFATTTAFTLVLPIFLSPSLSKQPTNQTHLTHSFSLILLGSILSTLATLNFSLALLTSLACAPLNFIRPLLPLQPRKNIQNFAEGSDYLNTLAIIGPAVVLYAAISPPIMLAGLSAWSGKGLEGFLVDMAKGWVVQGSWTALVVWGVWWPGWVVGGAVLGSGVWRGR